MTRQARFKRLVRARMADTGGNRCTYRPLLQHRFRLLTQRSTDA